MIRLFVGLALPEEGAKSLAALAGGIPGARWVEARNLHLTLRFIGEVEEGTAQDIHEALNEIRAVPFDLGLDGFGTFGRPHPNHLYASAEREPDLLRLQAKVDSVLARAGAVGDTRKFVPHVTLARFTRETPLGRVQEFIQHHSPFHAGPWPMEAFVLFRSHLGRGGAEYDAIAEYPLEGTGTF